MEYSPRRCASGAHVVEPVGQLDQDHPHVLRQGEQHLAEVLRLHAVGLPIDPADLGEPIDDGGHRIAEHVAHILQGEVGVLHGVVQ